MAIGESVPLSPVHEIQGKLIPRVLLLLPLSLLMLVADQVFTAIMVDIASKVVTLPKIDANRPEAREDLEAILKALWLLLLLEIIFLVVSCVILLLTLLAAISSSCSPKELFSGITGMWKRPLIAWLYIALISTILVAFVLVLITVLAMTGYSLSFIILSIMVVVSVTMCYLYLTMVWMLSVVVSVVEEDVHGTMDIEEAEEELIKLRRVQGFLLMLLLALVSNAISVGFVSKPAEIHRRMATKLATINIIVICVVSLVKLFMFVLYILLNYEWKNHREQLEGKCSLTYAVTITAYV